MMRKIGFVISIVITAASAVAQVPQISLPLVPSSATPGALSVNGHGLMITINGTGFTSSSQVNWNGSPRATTFVSSTRLTAVVTPEDLESPATAWVTVTNPGPPVTASNVAYFEVANPESSISLAKTDFPDGTHGGAVKVADLNHDGRLDVVVANNPGNSVTVLLGNGDGTFQAPASYNVANGASGFAIGDFNGDGNLDLAVDNPEGNHVEILLGNGDGTFRSGGSFTVGSNPVYPAAGDFNGDGKLDLAVPNNNDGTVSVLLGNGDGTFQPAVNYTADSGAYSVAVGDFNGDGNPDLAVTNSNSNNIDVFLGNGDGTFQPQVKYAVDQYPSWVSVADLNSDGKLDLAVANYNGNDISVLLGNGDGTFQPAVNYATGGSGSQGIAVSDFNGDGRVDLAVADAHSGDVSVLLGNGDGTFQPPVNYTVGPGDIAANSIAGGDFNGDGRMDLVATNYMSSSTVSVLIQPTPASAGGAATTTTLASSSNPSDLGDSVTFTATVTATSGTPTGTITFSVDSTVLLTAPLDSNGQASASATSLTAGSHTIVAAYTPSSGSGFAPGSGSLIESVISLANVATLNGNNTFVGNQAITGLLGVSGSISAPSFIGGTFTGDGSGLVNLNPASLALGTAGINVTGNAASATTAGNALSLGGQPPSYYAPSTGSGAYVAKAGDTLTGALNLPTNGLVAGTNQFVLANGFVGIGSTAPYAPLHVRGTASNLPNISDPNLVAAFDNGGNASNLWVNVKPENSGGTDENYYFALNGGMIGGLRYNVTGDYLALFHDSQSNDLNNEPFVLKGRSVGIGTLTPRATLEVNGTAQFDSTVAFAAGQTFPGTGTITGVTTGTGLLGGGATGNIPLSVDHSTVAFQSDLATSVGTAETFATGAANTAQANAINASEAYALGTFVPLTGGTMTGTLNAPALNVSGNSTTMGAARVGSVAIGNGTPIIKHLSMTVTPSFPNLNSLACTSANFPLTGAADGDTLALGVPNSMLNVDVPLVYIGWVSAANTVTLRACNFSGTKQKVAATGSIRIDLWKH